MVAGIEVHGERLRSAAESGHLTATDLADYLVRRGIPFRDAHEIVGRTVRRALESKRHLSDLALAELQGLCPAIGEDVYECLTLDGSVASRNHLGGTAPTRVRAAVEQARQQLAASESPDS